MPLNCLNDWQAEHVANLGFGLDSFSDSDFGAAGIGVLTALWTEDGSSAELNMAAGKGWRRRSLQVEPFGKGPAGAAPYGGKASGYGLVTLPWTEST